MKWWTNRDVKVTERGDDEPRPVTRKPHVRLTFESELDRHKFLEQLSDGVAMCERVNR